MSDGERVALYLMAQCLCMPPDSIIIIDEPEIHLHKSLMSRLWSKLEEAQPSCLFVYITHDLDFAASRVGARKIWVKSYNGLQWDWDEIPKEEALPEPVLLEILGSRKKILFVEGNDKTSLDYKIYQAIYPDFLIMPCGSCENVIEATQAMKKNPALQHIEAFGIIDIDYKNSEKINKLKLSNIFVLNVAEIENLLCVPELTKEVGKALSYSDDDIQKIQKKIEQKITDKVKKELENQASKRSVSEIQSKLDGLNAKECKDKESLKTSFENFTKSINIDEIYNDNERSYQEAIDSRNYEEILRIYNNKGLVNCVSQEFSLKVEAYKEQLLRFLSDKDKKEAQDNIILALKKYAPVIPPT